MTVVTSDGNTPVLGARGGLLDRLPVPADVVVAADDERARELAAPYGQFMPDIRAGRATGTDEPPITTTCTDHRDRVLTHENLATAWGPS